jgi:hypothetical protein
MKWPFQKDPLDDFFKSIEWDDFFAQLITITDDERLCDRFADLVEQERPLASFDEKEPDLCVRLAWGAKGPLDNNGFGCLFNCDDKPADPNPINTRRAFEVLGLSKAVEAFDLAFSAFEDSIPPRNVEQRMKIWDAADESLRKQADEAWYDNDDVTPKVAAFIRSRKDELLLRYEFVRKWPENPFKYIFVGIGVKSSMHKPASPTIFEDEAAFTFRSNFEKVAWIEETDSARKTFGVGFGPRHPAYPKWEKWYLENRHRLVETVKRRYTGG